MIELSALFLLMFLVFGGIYILDGIYREYHRARKVQRTKQFFNQIEEFRSEFQ